MWRLVALASLALAFAFGGVADAKCGVCIDSISARVIGTSPENGNLARKVALTVSGRRESPENEAPAGATAVVMQVDGNRTKCINVSLPQTSDSGGVVTYAGTFIAYGTTSHSGRLDVGGSVFEFSVPLDGTPGKVTLVDVVAPPVLPQQVVRAPAPVVAANAAPASGPVIIDEAPAPAGNIFDQLATPDGTGMLLAFAVIAFIGATVLIERRRATGPGPETAIEA